MGTCQSLYLIGTTTQPQWTVSANGEWMSSDGQYPYTLRYGNAADDLTSREKRKNTDVETFRAEAGLYGNFSDKEQWRLKTLLPVFRGLPKATTLYNDFSAQHLWDKNAFIQSQYKRNSAGNGYSGLLPNGTGVTSIIWTLLSKTMKAKQRTAITSRNTIFPPPCYTGC